MSKLAKYLAKGSDRTKEEWEKILKVRRKGTYTDQSFFKKGLKKNEGVIFRNEN